MRRTSFITASVFGLIGIGASNVAFADWSLINDVNTSSTYCKTGFYVGVQGGRSDTFYKQQDVLSPAYNGTSSSLYAKTVDDIGIGGRVFAGYQFLPGFAAEIGYTQYGKTDFSALGVSATSPGVINQYSGDVTEHATDLVGKATLPIQYGLGLYAKAGIAYIAAEQSLNESQNNLMNTVYDKSYQAVRPTYGAGIDYTIPNSNFDVDVSWTRVQGGGAIPNADLWAAGIAYKFA